MKNQLFFTVLVLCTNCAVFAQSSSPSATPQPVQISIMGSYYAKTDINVYPYFTQVKSTDTPSSVKATSSASTFNYTDPTAFLDQSIHFKLKQGTKFYITDIKSTNGTTIGYVIKVWRFKSDSNKKKYFDSLVNNAITTATQNMQNRKDAQEKVDKDSSAVKASQTAAAVAQVTADNAKKKLLAASLGLDVKTAIKPADQSKPRIADFIATQNKLKTQLLTGEPADKLLKDSVIKNAANLPASVSPAIAAAQAENTKADADLKSKKDAYSIAKQKLENSKAKLTTVLRDLYEIEQANNNQTSSIKNAPDTYKETKRDIKDVSDIPQDTTSPYLPFDNLAYLDSWANDGLFFISASDFNNNTTTIFPSSDSFTWGFLTLPIKLRFDNNGQGRYNFEQNLNFGLTFGIKHQFPRHDDMSINYLAGVSIVDAPLNDKTDSSPATSAAAFSFSVGSMFQYNKFQIGLYIGKDFVGDNAYKFAYQGKTWVGLAIGVSLFGEGQTTATPQEQK